MRSHLYRLFLMLFAGSLMGLSGCGSKPDNRDEPMPFKRLLEDQILVSTSLNKAINYAVILPEGYDSSTESFPVVYLLHGYGGDETDWYRGGNIRFYIDRYNAEMPQAIFVMPQGYNSYWVNKFNGNNQVMDMVVKELVPLIDDKFRTIKSPGSRAVMGFSMGGYGALILSAKNPTVFSTSIILSMSFRTDEQYLREPQEVFDGQWGSIFGGYGTKGNSRLTDYYKQYSPFHFFGNPTDPSLSGQNYFIDCGDDEETLTVTNDAMHVLLRDKQVPHQYRVRNGYHDWNYWHSSLPEAFKYIGYAFNNMNYPATGAKTEVGVMPPAETIKSWQLTGETFNYKVVVPATYSSGTTDYPVVYVIHERTFGAEQAQSNDLLSLLSNHIKALRLTASLIVELPLQGQSLTQELLEKIMSEVKVNYRTRSGGKHAVLVGNGSAGALAFSLSTTMSSSFNACLLFDAGIPVDASVSNQSMAYYLDIADEGINYRGYNSLYGSLKRNNVPYEYRVRQGTSTHESFITGLDEAPVFINKYLKF